MSEERSSKLDLSEKRQALVAALLREQEAASASGKRIPRRKEQGLVPLAFAQERLWFLDQYYPGTSLYNIPAAYPFQGPLNILVFRTSLNEIIRRHESLRSRFINQGGRPLQSVAAELELEVPLIDLAKLPENQRQQEAARLMNEEGVKPFDLSRGPLLRATLIRMSEQYHILLLVMHHIISDAWSMSVFINEFNSIYGARSLGQAVILPELPIQYPDFAVWQREWMQGEGQQEQLDYWKQALDGLESDRLILPIDHPRPQTLTFNGATISYVFSPQVSQQLRALTHAAGVTPYITLLTGFKVLLYRYTGQRAIVVGMPTANRNRTELEGIIGFFVNTLVLRTEISADLSFRQTLARVREVVLGAHAHQDLPFERLVEELQPARALNTNPLFQVMFDFQNQSPVGGQGPQPLAEAAPAGQESGDLQIVSIDRGGTSKFDLTLSLMESGQRFGGSVEYNTELFDEATILRLIGHYHTLLEAASATPMRTIGQLPLMLPAERQQVLGEWNSTRREFPLETCVHEQFEAQVEHQPEAAAVIFESQRLSYRELNRRANGLARQLRQRGVGPEVVVGICMEASIEMVVAILGVLKASGAYLPLDAAYPDERLSYMLTDADVGLILTQPQLMEKVSRLGTHEVLTVTDGAAQFAEEENPPTLTTSRNACYVIYTSGSTGRPKGIVIEHRNVVNLVHALREIFGVGQGRRTLQFASFSFDQSVREFFETLLSGATLCLAQREEMMPGEPLLRVLRSMEISDVTLVPSIQAHLPHADLPALQTLTAGGEACPQSIVNRWGAGRRYFNAYGPSETTFASSTAECFPNGDKPTIGRPLANVQYYVVDERMEPCPVGIAGELLIGGMGLARGYVGRPDLTAQQFIPNPFSQGAGERLYRTGDLVRQLPDGQIDYLGRIDQQVKVRGFRIELGEIEAVLLEHRGLAAAAVTCYTETPGENQLAAYIVGDGEELIVEHLRSFLSLKLPEYMVPSVFILLDQMPLTGAGKVDREALPSPETVRRHREHVKPRTPLEQVLAGIWGQVLGNDNISVHDNFFVLGGHSLLITQVTSRVRDILHTEIPIHLIFELPTIAQLASALETQPGSKVARTAELVLRLSELDNDEVERFLQQASSGNKVGATVAESLVGDPAPVKTETTDLMNEIARSENTSLEQIARRKENGHAPLSFAQERVWILDQFQPGNIAYNVFRPIPFSGPLDLAVLKRSLDQLVERHETLRTIFPLEDGRPVQFILPSLNLELRVKDLRELSPHERQEQATALIQGDVLRPFDLARGPLLRTLMLMLSPAENLLALSIHHIISDEHSIRILTRDLLELYEANLTGRAASLPSLPIQCADFAAWQRERMQGELLDKHLSFWREQLADAPTVLELPTDHPRPAVQSFGGDMEVFDFSPQLSATLEGLNRQENVTMFMTILAAYMALLHRYTGQRKVVVGAPIANRNRAEIENLIGFFTNTMVLPAAVRGDMTFRQLLHQVRELTLKAYAHQDLPFERLVEELNPQRNLNINPLFQAMFILQKATGIFPIGSGGGGAQRDASPGGQFTMAKFDLTLYMEETERGFVGGMEYATELFERPTIRRMIGHFASLLENVAANPDQSISSLRLLAPDESQKLVSDWGTSPVPGLVRGVDGIQALFETQVKLTPDAAALVSEGQSISYRELNERANRIAHHLMMQGVDPETIVAVYMERGPELLTAILGILKAGGAYLPLDPSFPKERLSFMLEDAQATLLLTEPHLSAGLPATAAVVVQVSNDAEWLSAESPANSAQRTLPESPAYVIYTSGSTGTPKGVVLPHRTLNQLIAWQLNRPGFSGGRRTLQYSSPSFDVSLQEILTTWCSGGTLVYADADTRRDFTELAQYIFELKVERLFLPYVALQQLAEATSSLKLPAPLPLREVITAGEQLKVTPAVASFFAQLDNCQLSNQYGPSESHVVSEYLLDSSPQGWESLPPIGRPVAGAKLYVLDAAGQLAPTGVVGELYIGGDGIGRCYLNRPGLTGEKFLPDPFANIPGARMYRTGDRVKYRADGNLEFLGRCDQQLKIRGFRVEPGEVEACLLKHPLVAEAVVAAVGQPPAEVQLVGYIVPTTGAAPEQLGDFLRETLPEYLIPSQFVFLDELPVTATGKVDRLHLPTPQRTRPNLEQQFVGPRSPLEEQIAQIWGNVLGIPNPGIHDNFFELGGHSLMATQLTSRLRSQFAIEIPVRVVFEEPTIARLSLSVVQSRAAGASEEDMVALLTDLEQLSEDEIETLLSGEAPGR
jgi:amino acid adenylation domain-containing protein